MSNANQEYKVPLVAEHARRAPKPNVENAKPVPIAALATSAPPAAIEASPPLLGISEEEAEVFELELLQQFEGFCGGGPLLRSNGSV